MIVAQPAKAPKHAGRSYTAERANECWALDDWEHVLADGAEVKILDIIDDHSRYAAACGAMEHCTGAASMDALGEAAGWLGLPERFWSDNAKAFTATLANALAPLGVTASHTRPHSPNSNGKAERFHETAQKWLAKQPRAATISELQHQLDLFRLAYNTQRPHRSLGRRFPADVWISRTQERARQPTTRATHQRAPQHRAQRPMPRRSLPDQPRQQLQRPTRPDGDHRHRRSRLHRRTPHPPTHPQPPNHLPTPLQPTRPTCATSAPFFGCGAERVTGSGCVRATGARRSPRSAAGRTWPAGRTSPPRTPPPAACRPP